MTQQSLVLVTVDCLRADHTGFMGYPHPTTPFLDGLAAESFVFPTAIVGGAPTYYSLPAILASRHPLSLGRDIVGLAPEEPTLASAFQQAGYSTAFFGAGNPYISSLFGYDFGFETFRDFPTGEGVSASEQPARSRDGWMNRLNRKLQQLRPHLKSSGAIYDELYFQYCQRRNSPPSSLDALRRFPAADVIIDQACSWLTSAGRKPFFLWLHLMDPHAPYYPTPGALELMGHATLKPSRALYLNSFWNRSDLSSNRLSRHRSKIVALYDAGIRWVDEQIARLVGALRRLGIWDRSIFAFTADHGEEFLDHGGRHHPPSRLSEEIIRVPQLLRVPGIGKIAVPNSPFSLLHLAPTLLDAAGLGVPSAFQGISHWGSLQDGTLAADAAICESIATCTNPVRLENRRGPRALAIREARFKMVLDFSVSSATLFDLEADPGEQAPLSPDAEKPVRRRLLERAREHLQLSPRRCDPAFRARSQLRDLRLQWQFPEAKAS